MKKRIVIISTFIIALIICLIAISNNSKKTFKQDGVTYALTLDGASTNSFPAKGLYKVRASCNGATGKWDYDNWKLYIDNITGDVSCNIAFNTITKTYLNQKIMDLATTTASQTDWKVVEENGYRYEGKNPDNYVWFNNEMWRIIGVFGSETHGVTNASGASINLVKIIREKPIGSLAWHKSNTNDWSNSSLNSLLNGAYYNAQDGTESGNCYGYSTTVGVNCNYTKIGIQSNYRRLIKNVTWHLGGITATYVTVEAMYGYERGTAKYGSNLTTTTGYIGLMYPSDYGYSVLASSCTRTTNIGSYNTEACAGQSWLYGEGDEWTLTPASPNSFYVAYVAYYGELNPTGGPGTGHAVRPVLYLDASVYVIDGNGSMESPYVIAE